MINNTFLNTVLISFKYLQTAVMYPLSFCLVNLLLIYILLLSIPQKSNILVPFSAVLGSVFLVPCDECNILSVTMQELLKWIKSIKILLRILHKIRYPFDQFHKSFKLSAVVPSDQVPCSLVRVRGRKRHPSCREIGAKGGMPPPSTPRRDQPTQENREDIKIGMILSLFSKENQHFKPGIDNYKLFCGIGQ